jgi:hypothetical protein
MSLEIRTLIKYKLLKPHPISEMFEKLWQIIIDDNDEYHEDKYYDEEQDVLKVKKNHIIIFNRLVCEVCIKRCKIFCKKCNKYYCNNCNFSSEENVCVDCIDKCYVCKAHKISYPNDMKKCYSCKLFYCTNLYDNDKQVCCVDQCKYTGYDGVYDFCSKKCIPITFYKERVIKSLNRKFKTKKLDDNLRLYNLKIRADSVLCKKYINGFLDKEWTTEKVAQKMCEIKYLFDVYDITTEMNKLTWTEINYWKKKNIETFMGAKFDLAKSKILKQIGDFPIVWPWKTKVKIEHTKSFCKILDDIKILPEKKGFLGGIEYQIKKEEYITERKKWLKEEEKKN